MGIQGSVVVSLSAGSNTVTLPEAGLTIVGLLTNVIYITIPIDSSRIAVFPTMPHNSDIGSATALMRRVTWKVNGTSLNVTSVGSGTAVFYYGSPLPNSKKLTDFAGIYGSVSLSAATTGTITMTFPSGNLNLTGMSGAFSSSEGYVEYQWNTSSGQEFTAFVVDNPVIDESGRDILPMELKVSQTVTVNVTSGASVTDTVYCFMFYQYVA